MVEVLKVSSRSNPNAVAGALAGVLRQSGAVEVQVVGAGALNQAIKAIAIARGFVAPSNIDLVCIPTFADIEIDGEGRTAIRLAVEDRARRLGVSDDLAAHAPPAPRPPAYRPAPVYSGNGSHAPDILVT
jgi:stage V sporulation protein S